MELTDDDVLAILKLFERSKFDFLELEHGERKITVSKAGAPRAPAPGSTATTSPAPPVARPVPRAMPAAVAKPVVPLAAPAIPAPASGVVAVTAPTVGKFYAAASPADPPYVQVGSTVAVGSTIGLIEVMKTFTAIKAEAAGTIEQILVASGDYVEFGQSLFMLRPSNAS